MEPRPGAGCGRPRAALGGAGPYGRGGGSGPVARARGVGHRDVVDVPPRARRLARRGHRRPRVVRRGARRRHDVPRCVDDQVGAGPSGRPGSPRRCTCADRRGDQPRPRAGGHRVRRHPGARRPHDDHGRRLGRGPPELRASPPGCSADADAGDSRGLLRSVRRGVAPRSRFSYCTADSQVLDWVRERATGFSYVDDVARLWKALGCTRDAYVAVDGTGVVLAGGALAAATRDWAKVALLAVDGRTDQGERLLDADWPRPRPGRRTRSSPSAGCPAASPRTPGSATTGDRWTTATG